MVYYLGIDGGGTKTACVVGDENSILATSVAGPSNIVRVGEAEVRRSLQRGIEQACAAAGISPQQLTRTCVGAAGAASSAVAATIHGVVGKMVAGEVVVTGDMQIALEAAFGGGAGIVVIAGTGSIAYGRDAERNTARAGGWGFAVSDEGSAYWIGRSAVAAIFRAWDLGPGAQVQGEGNKAEQPGRQTQPGLPLFEAIRQCWNIRSIDDLLRAANANPPPNFAALLPAIVACADAGDELSRRVLSRAGGELAQLASVVVSGLFPLSSGKGSSASASSPANLTANINANLDAHVPLAMVGGVFRHSSLVRQAFYNEMAKQDPRVKLLAQVVEPVEGALRLARSGRFCRSFDVETLTFKP